MAAPYSADLRRRVLAAYERGYQTAMIAKMFSVSESWTRRVKQRHRERGEVNARPMGGVRRIKINRERLASILEERPDATLAELCERIGVECSISGIDKALKSIDLTFKKKRFTRQSRIVRTLSSDAMHGTSGRMGSTSDEGFLSMKHGRKRT
jgi:transposase